MTENIRDELERLVAEAEPLRVESVDHPIAFLLGREADEADRRGDREEAKHLRAYVAFLQWRDGGQDGPRPPQPSDTPADGWTEHKLAECQRYSDNVDRAAHRAEQELERWKERDARREANDAQ